MFLLYILLGAVLVTGTSAGVIFVCGYDPKWLRQTFGVSGCTLLTLAFLCLMFSNGITNDIDNLRETYDDLMLYYSTVDNSTNEYVRYDYYEAVTVYNDAYDRLLAQSEDFWIGWLYSDDWDSDLGRIDFQLHGDNYGG